MIHAGIPYTLLQGQEANDVPTFWLLLYRVVRFNLDGVLGFGFRSCLGDLATDWVPSATFVISRLQTFKATGYSNSRKKRRNIQRFRNPNGESTDK